MKLHERGLAMSKILIVEDEESIADIEKIPVGIKIGDNSWVKDTGWYEMDVAVGFGENAKNMDLALEFLEYISRE